MKRASVFDRKLARLQRRFEVMADADSVVEFVAGDLAPGDGKSLELDRSELEVARITSAHDPLFASAYERLWNEFGPVQEMETREVIERRLGWQPAARKGDCWLRYELILVRRHGQFVAVRDHTAVVTDKRAFGTSSGAGAPAPTAASRSSLFAGETPAGHRPKACATISQGRTPQAVVHLSHVLVDPAWRRTGLAGWLRSWPVQTARACLRAAGLPATAPITLVAEMEHPEKPDCPPLPSSLRPQREERESAGWQLGQRQDAPQSQPQSSNRMTRLAAYGKAGFRKVDPVSVDYFQPDFRPPEQIDASGRPRPLPFGLILRRVGREREQVIRGAELRQIVECLYHMYGAGFREQDMAAVWRSLQDYPGDEVEIPLVAPTSSTANGR